MKRKKLKPRWGRVFKRDGSANYWIAYCVRGQEFRESAGTTDEAEAYKLLEARSKEAAADEIGARTFIGPIQYRVRADELLDDLEQDYAIRHKDSLQFKSHIKPIRDRFGRTKAFMITPDRVDRYVQDRRAQGKADATINREVQLLGQTLKLGVERRKLASMPVIRHLREDNARQGFFEKADFEAVGDCLPEYLRDFYRFAYLSSWRKGEISSLMWADTDFEGNVIRLRPENSKNGKGRSLALEGELLDIIERRKEARCVKMPNGEVRMSEYVFYHVCRGKVRPVGDFKKAFKSACEAVGLKYGRNVEGGKTFHDLRRTGIRNMVRAGVPEHTAMSISGHKTRSVFDRYDIVDERDQQQAMLKTQEYLGAIPTERNVARFPKASEGQKK